MTQFDYVKSFVELSYAGNFSHELNADFSEEKVKAEFTISQLNQNWLAYLHEQFFIDVKHWTCLPALGMVKVLQEIADQESMNLLLPTPFDYPELLLLSSDKSNVHLLHSSAENHWKISPDQLENWCQEHEELCSSTFIYLPKPISGLAWKAGELKRLAEIAKSNKLILVREASMFTPAEESFFHFLPDSALIYINPYQDFNRSDWQFGYLMQPRLMKAQLNRLNEKLTGEYAPTQKAVWAMHLWLKSSSSQLSLLTKWEHVVAALRKEARELLHVTKLIISPGNHGIRLLLNFENYRVALGRKELFSIEAACAKIEDLCGVKLEPASRLGLAPNTLVAVMYLSNVGALDWLEDSEENIDGSFLYKHFWNCIDGAQKLAKFLNQLD